MTHVNLTSNNLVGGWRSDLENRSAILQRGLNPYAKWRQAAWEYTFEKPKELDPREWFDVHSQGNIGSCQGNALADAVELAYGLKYGPEIQLSRFWAYKVSQEADGINGDQGSTLEGGSKAVTNVGICLESSFPYPGNYSQGVSFYNQNKQKLLQEAANYKLKGHVPLGSWKDVVDFLATRSGIVQIGIMWGSSMDVGWEIKSYSPGGGGHSVDLAGYLEVSGWPDGIGLLLKNSWGTGWGRNGWALCSKAAIEGMLRAQFTVFIGRAEAESPVPYQPPDI